MLCHNKSAALLNIHLHEWGISLSVIAGYTVCERASCGIFNIFTVKMSFFYNFVNNVNK